MAHAGQEVASGLAFEDVGDVDAEGVIVLAMLSGRRGHAIDPYGDSRSVATGGVLNDVADDLARPKPGVLSEQQGCPLGAPHLQHGSANDLGRRQPEQVGLGLIHMDIAAILIHHRDESRKARQQSLVFSTPLLAVDQSGVKLTLGLLEGREIGPHTDRAQLVAGGVKNWGGVVKALNARAIRA